MSGVLEFTCSVDNDHHTVAGGGVLGAWSQVAWDFPIVGLLAGWDAGGDGAVGGDAVG